VLVQVLCNASPRNFTLIHTYVEAVGSRNLFQHAHCLLSDLSDFDNLLGGCLVVGAHVAIRANQEVPAVVRKQIQQRVGVLAAMNDQPLTVSHFWRKAEWTVVPMWLRSVLDVNQAMRRPQALEVIWNSGEIQTRLNLWGVVHLLIAT